MGTDGVVSERRWVLLFGRTHFNLSPLRRQVVELRLDKIVENALFLIVTSVNKDFSGLDA